MSSYPISFANAFAGIVIAARTQTNIRIHLFATTIVFLASVYFHISLTEGLILILTIAQVYVAEMFNTALEFLSDAVTKEQNQLIKYTKDVAAGGVFFSAALALVIGILIFLPKVIRLF